MSRCGVGGGDEPLARALRWRRRTIEALSRDAHRSHEQDETGLESVVNYIICPPLAFRGSI